MYKMLQWNNFKKDFHYYPIIIVDCESLESDTVCDTICTRNKVNSSTEVSKYFFDTVF